MISIMDVLGIVSERLEAAGIEYMLTGSYALAWYTTPRMTRDLDLVVAMEATDVDTVVAVFSPDFYIDEEAVRQAVASRLLFNLMHIESGAKVDLIIRKDSEYRQLEFSRRRRIEFENSQTWIVSREDLILSKLLWASDSQSELQLRDVKALLQNDFDRNYLADWAQRPGVAEALEKITA